MDKIKSAVEIRVAAEILKDEELVDPTSSRASLSARMRNLDAM